MTLRLPPSLLLQVLADFFCAMAHRIDGRLQLGAVQPNDWVHERTACAPPKLISFRSSPVFDVSITIIPSVSDQLEKKG